MERLVYFCFPWSDNLYELLLFLIQTTIYCNCWFICHWFGGFVTAEVCCFVSNLHRLLNMRHDINSLVTFFSMVGIQLYKYRYLFITLWLYSCNDWLVISELYEFWTCITFASNSRSFSFQAVTEFLLFCVCVAIHRSSNSAEACPSQTWKLF